jgi:hypothetical protein
MEEKFEVVRVEVAKLQLKPGDILLVRFRDWMTFDDCMDILYRLQPILPPGTSGLGVKGVEEFVVATPDVDGR